METKQLKGFVVGFVAAVVLSAATIAVARQNNSQTPAPHWYQVDTFEQMRGAKTRSEGMGHVRDELNRFAANGDAAVYDPNTGSIWVHLRS